MIKNAPSLTKTQKDIIINNITQNATKLSNNIITKGEYQAKLNAILKSCPQYDMTGLVKKNLVSNVCYGCDTP